MYSSNDRYLSPSQIEAKERARRLSINGVASLRKRIRRKVEKRHPGRPIGWLYGTLYFLDTRLAVAGVPHLPKSGGIETPNGNPFGGVRTGRRGAFQFSVPRRRPFESAMRKQNWW